MRNRLNNILVLFFILACISCGIKNKPLISKQTNKNNSDKVIDELGTQEAWFKQKQLEFQKSWLRLKNLYANELMSAEELGVIDCHGFDRNSAKLKLINEVYYEILNQNYNWHTYQTNDGLCIELYLYNGISDVVFFLNLEDSRILLSASRGFLFDKRHLTPPKILYKKTIFWTIEGTPCGDMAIKYLKDRTISTNLCEEIISC